MLRQVTRAAKRKHETDSEYEQAIYRAGRLGLSHREIVTAAQLSHGTVRAILTRGSTITDSGSAAEPQSVDSERDGLAAPTPARRRHASARPGAGRSQALAQLLRTRLSRSASH